MKYASSLTLCAFFLFILMVQQASAAATPQDPGTAAYLLHSEIELRQGQGDIDLFLKKLDALDALPDTHTAMYWKLKAAISLMTALEQTNRLAEAEALLKKYEILHACLVIADTAKQLANEGKPDEALKELAKIDGKGKKDWSVILTFSALPDITYAYCKAGKTAEALKLYSLFEKKEYVKRDAGINDNRRQTLDGIIRLTSHESQPDFAAVLKLFERLELCKTQGACPDRAVAEITGSLIEVMARAERFDDADMLYGKILALKDDPTAGEKTATTSANYSAKCRVRMFQENAAQYLLQTYDQPATVAKLRAVYDKAHAVFSKDVVGQGYLVPIAQTLIVKTVKTAKDFNGIVQTLTLPENILLAKGDDSATVKDGLYLYNKQHSARQSYLRIYAQLFLTALEEKNLTLAENLYKQSSGWKEDKDITTVRAGMKLRLEKFKP